MITKKIIKGISKVAPKIGKSPSKVTMKKSVPKFVPYYGGFGGKMSNGVGWGGEAPKPKKTTKILGSFKKGGKVKSTGVYKLHKGEKVVPIGKKKGKKSKKAKKATKPGDLFNKYQSKKTNNSRSADVVVKAEQNASHKFKGRGARKV